MHDARLDGTRARRGGDLRGVVHGIACRTHVRQWQYLRSLERWLAPWCTISCDILIQDCETPGWICSYVGQGGGCVIDESGVTGGYNDPCSCEPGWGRARGRLHPFRRRSRINVEAGVPHQRGLSGRPGLDGLGLRGAWGLGWADT